MSVEGLSSYCFYTIALPFQALLQNYLIWILLLIPCHFLFNRVVLVPVFSRPLIFWFCLSDYSLKFSLLLLLLFVCLFYCFCSACNNLPLFQLRPWFRCTYCLHICMYFPIFACSLTVMWGHVVGSRLWSIYGNDVSSLFTYYSFLLQVSTLLPLPLLYIEIIIIWDHICLDQSTALGTEGARNTAMVLNQWNPGWTCYHSIYSSWLIQASQIGIVLPSCIPFSLTFT